VELVIRCEESFSGSLEDRRLARSFTVGELFELICEQLGLPSGTGVPQPAHRVVVPRVLPPSGGWTRDTVWLKVVQICSDQLQIDPDDVTYSANFADDLGAS
jgi:acyl carrier protein